jgi:TrpR-related protein YerC/YecD
MAHPRLESTTRLFETILKLRTVDECYDFFEDLCTIRELRDISQRLEVAFLLHGGMSYQEVSKRTGVSATTISRVNRCLEYGSGGYRLAIGRAEETE